MCQIGLYDNMKDLLTYYNYSVQTTSILSAFFASLFAVPALQPFDFIATRLMNQPLKDGNFSIFTCTFSMKFCEFREID